MPFSTTVKSDSNDETVIVKRIDQRLMDLVSNDKIWYDAMENFLLAEPRREIPELGEARGYYDRARKFEAENDLVMARVQYETAAKIEMYHQNKENTIESLKKANSLADGNEQHREYHETILSNMDKALRIANEYYSTAPTP
jgi:hypothetical protein